MYSLYLTSSPKANCLRKLDPQDYKFEFGIWKCVGIPLEIKLNRKNCNLTNMTAVDRATLLFERALLAWRL